MPAQLDDVPWPVRSERLAIRRAGAEDTDAIWAIRSRDGVDEWLTRAADDRASFDTHLARPIGWRRR